MIWEQVSWLYRRWIPGERSVDPGFEEKLANLLSISGF
jgi:hypothetical protein